jgi:hypothetical protein
MTERANQAARFRLTNWGTFVDSEAGWPAAQKFKLGEEVKTRVFLSTESAMADVQGTIVGCFLLEVESASPRTSMYHIHSGDGRYFYVSANDTMKIVVPRVFGNDEDSDFQKSPPTKKRPREDGKAKNKESSGFCTKKKHKAKSRAPSPQQTPLLISTKGVVLVESGSDSKSNPTSQGQAPSPGRISDKHASIESPAPTGKQVAADSTSVSSSPKVRPAQKACNSRDQQEAHTGKHTYWVHRTRIACLRLIGNLNPWAAKDAGATWQKIATQIHEETKGVTERNSRGKLMNCQVMATNGTALMMWYIRQAERMDKAYSEKKEKATSGQTGMRKKAIEDMARANDDKPEEIEKEWDVLRHLRGLKEEAELAKKMEKSKSAALKRMKDDEMPEEIRKLACESKEVCLQGIRLLHKKKKAWEAEVQVLKTAGRHAVMSEQQKQEMQLLADLEQQRKQYSDYEAGEDEDIAAATSSDAQAGRRNDRGLKGSFGMLTAAVQQVSALMQQDDHHAQAQSAFKILTTSQLKRNLAQLDEDIEGGLKLEAGERALVREWQLKKYAQGLGNAANAAP